MSGGPVLVIAEQRDGTLNRASWEAIAGAQQLPGERAVVVLLPGSAPAAVDELAAAAVAEVISVASPLVDIYTPDGYTAALKAAIEQLTPDVVVLPHTYQTR
ncbi:MAG TPA: hypothetical protein VJP86_12370, partial [Vicinamibacterales bacterium]|nr:hypothetical protein [Vicinamibacterales bacterium]